MDSVTTNIGVLGAGSWGTALAVLLSENGHAVSMWEFDAEQAAALARDRENKKFLPGVVLPAGVDIETRIERAVEGASVVVFVVPSHAVRDVARALKAHAPAGDAIVVNAAKGLEQGTLKRMSEVILDEIPIGAERVCTLAGPSHAEEVGRRMPTSVVVAGLDVGTTSVVQRVFSGPYFRVYTNADLVGVELGVALKNVVAIAAGVCDGLEYGDNTKAALLTRGLAEITRLGMALGARAETFFGLAGVGDLVVTALSRHSRNRHVGERIGKGESLDDILSEMVMVAEGVRTARAAVELGRKSGVELPIIAAVHDVLFSGKDARTAINELMNRPLQEETNWLPPTNQNRG